MLEQDDGQKLDTIYMQTTIQNGCCTAQGLHLPSPLRMQHASLGSSLLTYCTDIAACGEPGTY